MSRCRINKPYFTSGARLQEYVLHPHSVLIGKVSFQSIEIYRASTKAGKPSRHDRISGTLSAHIDARICSFLCPERTVPHYALRLAPYSRYRRSLKEAKRTTRTTTGLVNTIPIVWQPCVSSSSSSPARARLLQLLDYYCLLVSRQTRIARNLPVRPAAMDRATAAHPSHDPLRTIALPPV